MDNIDDEFASIVGAEVAQEANSLLDRHIDRTRIWIAQCEADGETIDMRKLIQRILDEPNKRTPVIVAYGAALWRLIEQEKVHGNGN